MEKLDFELEVLKCKIHEEDVLDNFKDSLEKRLNEKYENYEPKRKRKLTCNVYNYFSKAVAVFACFVIVSTCAFADEIEGMFDLLFANTHKNIETAYEEGKMQKIDSEYQTYDGVSLKADYVSVNDKELCIMFNMNTDIDYKNLYIDNIELKDENDNYIYTYKENENKYIDIRKEIDFKRIDKNNYTVILVLSKNEGIFEQCKFLKVFISEIEFNLKNDQKQEILGNWNFEINLDELNGKS